MEFVNFQEAMDVLGEQGVVGADRPDGRLLLSLGGDRDIVHLRVVPSASSAPTASRDERTLVVGKERLADAVERLVHRLGLTQVLVLPLGRWRRLFDAVAFRLADNAQWREIDATASIELNTRDPLLCEPPDYHTLRALVAAMLEDAQAPDQGVVLASTRSPVMVELLPDGFGSICVAGEALAAEVERALLADSPQ